MLEIVAGRVCHTTWGGVVPAFLAVCAVACGGSTSIGQRTIADDGGGAASGSAGLASGGRSSAGGGTAFTGGSVGSGGASGGVAGAGAAPASGGSSGAANLCLGADGQLRPELKRCNVSEDCATLIIPTCCGSDQAAGIEKGKTCALPVLDCSGLGCAKFPYPRAEDGRTTEQGGQIGVRCDSTDSGQGVCRTYVAVPGNDAGASGEGGTTPCGTSTCGDNQVCALPPNNAGPAGPAFCVDIPAACTGPLQCSCFATDVCGGGATFCSSVTGRYMQCLFAP